MFDSNKKNDPQNNQKPRAVRPKHAATLIIVRRDEDNSRILLGRRNSGHDFMPNKFVFPGGRVDPADYRIKPATDLHPDVAERLSKDTTPQLARALAMAAIRETFEETGLLIGQESTNPRRSKSPHWRPFLEHGIEPSLGHLDLVARAITPPYRHKRFDARFFMIDAEHIQKDVSKQAQDSDELLELHWFTMAEAIELDLPTITRFVLEEAGRRSQNKTHPSTPGLFAFHRHGKPFREMI